MTPQLAFIEQPGKGLRVAADPVHDGNVIGDELQKWFVSVVDAIGRKEVIHAVDTNKSTLSDACKEDNDRAPRLRWFAVVFAMANDAQRLHLLQTMCRAAGYEPKPIDPLTPAEELALMRQHMAIKAAGALEDFDANVKGARR